MKLLCFAIFAVLSASSQTTTANTSSSKNIVQLAQSVPDLSTLVTALVAGKLTDALSGAGPFTVFAPTNEAFENVPASTLAHLLDPANIKELQSVLEYHVIAGAAVFSKDLKSFQMVKTLEGEDVKIVKAGRVIVNKNATVTSADNAASNGVVHIIDNVLIPPAGPPPTPGPPSPTPSPPAPAPTGNHLYFRAVTCNPQGCRCGDVDAAPRMPASLFDPSNARELKRYEDITVKLYKVGFARFGDQYALEVGRCKEIGYREAGGQAQGSVWAPTALMTPICKEQCHCTYPDCKDQPDDPKAGKFCSLCGPKFNQPIAINIWNGKCRDGDFTAACFFSKDPFTAAR